MVVLRTGKKLVFLFCLKSNNPFLLLFQYLRSHVISSFGWIISSCFRAREAEQSQDRPREGQVSDKVSRDSGVISPSDTGLETEDTEAEDPGCEEERGSKTGAPLQVHDTPTLVHNNNYLAPVKAELVTNELEEEEGSERLGARKLLQHKPPPYHIAATKSKQAGNFYNIRNQPQQSRSPEPCQEEEHFYENQEAVKRAGVNGHSKPLERKSSFLSDGTFESISEVSNKQALLEILVSCSDKEVNCIQAHETASKLMKLHPHTWNFI